MSDINPSLTKIITTAVEAAGLSQPDGLRLLSDAELLRIPGIGRSKIRQIREVYPYDELSIVSQENIELHSRIYSMEKDLRYMSEREIEIGDLFGVASVRVLERCVLIRLAEFKEIIWIETIFDPLVERSKDEYDEGFGYMPREGLVMADQTWLRFTRVRQVTLKHSNNFSDGCWTKLLVFHTLQGKFCITLYSSDAAVSAPLATRNRRRKPEELGKYHNITISFIPPSGAALSEKSSK